MYKKEYFSLKKFSLVLEMGKDLGLREGQNFLRSGGRKMWKRILEANVAESGRHLNFPS